MLRCARRTPVAAAASVASRARHVPCVSRALAAAPVEERTIDVALALASTPALGAVGGIARTGSGLRTVAVVRTGATVFRAFSLVSPHAGSLVQVEGGAFVCRNHGSRFAADGALAQGPATSGLVELSVAFDVAAQAVRVTGRV